MKLSDEYQYIVLCEDAQMKSFILSFLISQGISSRKIRVRNYPAGSGCGEAFVRTEYPNEILYLRSVNYNKIALIVATDADGLSCGDRRKILDKEALSLIPGWGRTDEVIMIWIPKREIETWIRFFGGYVVDETMSFSHTGKPVGCKEEAKLMSEYCQGISSISVLPSIELAKIEYDRTCSLQK